MTLAEEKGLLRWRDLEARDMPRSQLRLMVNLGFLRTVARGLWRPARFEFPAAVVAASRVPRGVLCLKTALWFHGLLEEEPDKVWMAIGEKARKPRWQEPPLHVVRFSGRALSEGIEYHSIQGVQVPVYSVAKTVADLFKYRGKLGYPIAVNALRRALLSGLCSQDELLRLAGICRVEKSMVPYLEVLRARWGSDLVRAEEARAVRQAQREALKDKPLPGTAGLELG